METKAFFNYKGQDFTKITEVIDHALKLPENEQDEFVEAYAKAGPYALQNVGYVSGYYSDEAMIKIQEIFKTSHPIFGRRKPAADEAYKAGLEIAKELIK